MSEDKSAYRRMMTWDKHMDDKPKRKNPLPSSEGTVKTEHIVRSPEMVENMGNSDHIVDTNKGMSRDDRFRATVYAMNTLLVQKGIYSPDEFESHFGQWMEKNGGSR